jgi:intracellular sulfur oxidation DsrE/DsrF family protein
MPFPHAQQEVVMSESPVLRRSFLARLSAGIAAFGVTSAVPAAAFAAPVSLSSNELDDWMMSFKGGERVFYDSVTAAGGMEAVLFARNFLKFSQDKLGTKDGEMSVIVGFRHMATPLGYNDAMWAKYPLLAEATKTDDPKTKKRATRNVPLHDEQDGFPGTSLPALRSHGVQFSVCGAATAYIAGLIAGAKGNAKAVEADLVANLVPGARIVPAGVVAVQRAQKAHFAYTYTG